MRRFLGAAGVAGLITAGLGFGSMGAAQSVAQLGGPAEGPPAGFSGQQYVDSRGCVFMRAGFAGQISWVPRIGRDRRPLCGQVTGAQATARLQQPAEAALPAAAAPPITAAASAPMATIASKMPRAVGTGVIAPVPVPGLVRGLVRGLVPAGANAGQQTGAAGAATPARLAQGYADPAQSAQGARGLPVAGGQGQALGCPAEAPVLQNLPLRAGGFVQVCTRGDGSATGWRSPSYVASAQPGAALRGQGADLTAHAQAAHSQIGHNAMPRGASDGAGVQYVAAWQDDRLNPLRGLGTAAGWQNQAQVWSNTVPARPVMPENAPSTVPTTVPSPVPSTVSASTRSDPNQGRAAQFAAAQGQIYVQVGTFAQRGNVQNAAARLAALGLPVASAKSTRGGQALVAVLAGPFDSAAAAQQALGHLRGAGFGDAFVR